MQDQMAPVCSLIIAFQTAVRRGKSHTVGTQQGTVVQVSRCDCSPRCGEQGSFPPLYHFSFLAVNEAMILIQLPEQFREE